MELHELRGYKKELESRLIHSIARDLKWFEDMTGWNIEDIQISMVNVTTFEDPRPKYVLGNVSVELEDI